MYTSVDMDEPVTPPTSWRAVYDLVRDTRSDILTEVSEVKDEVKGLTARFDTHMLEHAVEKGQRNQRSVFMASIRTFISVVVPIPAAILALLAMVRPH